MECDSEFRELASHNPFVADLEQQGYHLDFVNGFFTIFGVPYLDEEGALQHGDLFSNVKLNGWVIDPPIGDHQMWFRGGRPHGGDGHQLRLGGGPHELHISDLITASQSFSFKLTSAPNVLRDYESFEEKIQTYLDAIVSPALDRYSGATPLRV